MPCEYDRGIMKHYKRVFAVSDEFLVKLQERVNLSRVGFIDMLLHRLDLVEILADWVDNNMHRPAGATDTPPWEHIPRYMTTAMRTFQQEPSYEHGLIVVKAFMAAMQYT